MTSRRWLLASVALVLVQAVPANHKTPLEIDEQVTYYIANGQTPNSVWRRAFEESATPPGYFWLVKTSSGVGRTIGVGSGEFWLRLPSLACYAGALWLAWRVARREFGSGAGEAAAVIMALHAVGIDKTALQARPYPLGLLLTLVALDRLFVLRRGRWCSTDASVLGLALAGLCWTHYLFASLWIPAVAQVLLTREYAPFRGRLLGTMALSGAWCLPLIPGALRVGAIGPALSWVTEPPGWQPLDAILGSVGVVAALAAALALRFTRNRVTDDPRPASDPRPAMTWLAAWIVLPAAALIGLSRLWHQPALAQLRYLLPTIAPAILLVCSVLAVAARRRHVVVAALVYSLAAGHVAVAWNRLNRPVWHDSEWKEAGELLRTQASAADLVFVLPGLVEANLVPLRYSEPGFQEYASSRLSDFYAGRGFPRLVLPMNFPDGDSDYRREYVRRVQELRRLNGVVWLVVSADTDLGVQCQHGFEGWIETQGFKVDVVRPNPVARILRCTPVE